MTSSSSCIDRKRWKSSVLGHEICKCEGSRGRSLWWGSTKGVRIISSWTDHGRRRRREWEANWRKRSLGHVQKAGMMRGMVMLGAIQDTPVSFASLGSNTHLCWEGFDSCRGKDENRTKEGKKSGCTHMVLAR
jgi:hypothetical protein